jgi:U3 small nucleolar RNA-associated protein 20
LTTKHDDLVWRTLFEELKTVTLKRAEVDDVEPLPSWADSNPMDGDSLDDPWEDERSWRDPSARKLRAMIAKWINGSEFLSADLRKV